MKYWQEKIGAYVRRKREAAGMNQEDVLGLARRTTVAKLEQGVSNFELETLLEILDRVQGDPSEAFASPTPMEYRHLPHRRLLDQVVEVIVDGDEIGMALLESATKTAYARLQKKRRRLEKFQ